MSIFYIALVSKSLLKSVGYKINHAWSHNINKHSYDLLLPFDLFIVSHIRLETDQGVWKTKKTVHQQFTFEKEVFLFDMMINTILCPLQQYYYDSTS